MTAAAQEPAGTGSGQAGRGSTRGSERFAVKRLVGKRFVVVAVLVLLDLWSKSAVFGWLSGDVDGLVYDHHGHPRYPLSGSWFALMLSTNPGAAFGQLGQFPKLLVVARIVAVVVLTYLLVRMERRQPVLVTALVLVLAGALGNLFDNLFLGDGTPFAVLFGGGTPGEVRDFIDVYFTAWDWHFPTFNVADSCITCGAVLLFLSGLFPGHAAREEASEAGAPGIPGAATDPRTPSAKSNGGDASAVAAAGVSERVD